MNSPNTASGEAFNELDPHGAEGHGQHASHIIVGPLTLRTILALLLVLTVATVGLAQAEMAIQNAFHILLPWWVNVAVAMSIAVVKAFLVMAFFMQLKYDNPINTVLMALTFSALATFLFFTGLDLFSRGAIDPIKQGQIVQGGTGIASSGNKPLVVAARERLLSRLETELGSPEAAAAEFARIKADIAGHGHGESHDTGMQFSDENRSRPAAGRTDALSETVEAHEGHGGHDAGHSDEHDESEHTGAPRRENLTPAAPARSPTPSTGGH